jgi:hypothetical protein
MGGVGEYHMTGVTAILAGARTPPALAVVASNVSRTTFGFASEGTVTSEALPNTTITGGVAPYTQNWTLQTGGSVSVDVPTALNPSWTAIVTNGAPNTSTWRVTVTDAMSATAFFDITVTLTWVQI